ncbi:MAG: tetraacyldisaccharide 4'-kinase, partial [Pyrinomonadaceae bacterium]
TASESFGDHHIYDRHDIQRIELSAKSAGAEILITTAKDAVKLRDLSFGMPCFVVEIEIDLDDADAFARLI